MRTHDFLKSVLVLGVFGLFFIILKLTGLKFLPFMIEAAVLPPLQAIVGSNSLSAAEKGDIGATKLKELTDENSALRKQLGLNIKPERHLVEGQLVYADRSLMSNKFLIRLSDPQEKVSENMPVVAPGDILLVKVSRVEGRFVWVKFIDDADAAFSVVTKDTSLKGITKPSLSGLGLNLAGGLQNSPNDGEIVYTDTLDPDVPAGLAVGKIKITGPKEMPLINIETFFKPLDAQVIFIIKDW